jgi:hypothetical protein
MTIIDEGKQLRLEAAKLRLDRRRRYPIELRRRLLDWVERATAAGFSEAECGKAVGIKTWRFKCWRQAPEPTEAKEDDESLSLVPIHITEAAVESGLTVVAPSGHRIEGLTLEQVVALLQELA